jgi:hypothetical protein
MPQQARRKPATKNIVVRSRGLDTAGLAYAKLLADPCNAPLVSPVFNGADGGLLIRAENNYNAGASIGTTTAGVFVWAPGAIGNNAGNGSAIAQGESTIPGGAITLGAISSGYQPGYGFLTSNSSECRCVAACMEIFFAGTEVQRSGLIASGNIMGGSLYLTESVNAQGSMVLFERYDRTPDCSLMINWRPTNFDQNYTVANNATTFTEISRRGALGFAYFGLPAGVGVNVRMVAVYEYAPSYALGLTSVFSNRSWSENTLDQVINFLDKAGPWTARLLDAYAPGMGAMVTGGASIMRQIAYSGTRNRLQLA